MSSILAITIISFLLEIFVSSLVPISSLFNPLFVVTSFIILYKTLHKKNITLRYAIIVGLIYDVFTDTLFINMICFAVIFLIIKAMFFWMNDNLVNILFIELIVIVSYRIINYLLLCVIGYLTFSYKILYTSIYTSIIINILYLIVLYFINKPKKRYMN